VSRLDSAFPRGGSDEEREEEGDQHKTGMKRLKKELCRLSWWRTPGSNYAMSAELS
jgi:hypothetical protein